MGLRGKDQKNDTAAGRNLVHLCSLSQIMKSEHYSAGAYRYYSN